MGEDDLAVVMIARGFNTPQSNINILNHLVLPLAMNVQVGDVHDILLSLRVSFVDVHSLDRLPDGACSLENKHEIRLSLLLQGKQTTERRHLCS